MRRTLRLSITTTTTTTRVELGDTAVLLSTQENPDRNGGTGLAARLRRFWRGLRGERGKASIAVLPTALMLVCVVLAGGGAHAADEPAIKHSGSQKVGSSSTFSYSLASDCPASWVVQSEFQQHRFEGGGGSITVGWGHGGKYFISVQGTRTKPDKTIETCASGTAEATVYDNPVINRAYFVDALPGSILDPPEPSPSAKVGRSVYFLALPRQCAERNPKHDPANPFDDYSTFNPCDGSIHVDPGDGSCGFPYCVNGRVYAVKVYEDVGVFDAKLELRNPAGVAKATVPVTINEANDPKSGFAWNMKPDHPPLVAGNQVHFQSSGFTTGGVRSYAWDFGDGTTSSERDPIHVFAAADEYDVTLRVTNLLGTDSMTQTINIQPKAGGAGPTTASFTFSPQRPVIGQRVNFFDTSTGTITRWRWNFADGSKQSIARNPSHTYADWGRRNVELWVSNAFGRKGIILFIDVLRNDVPPGASFTWTPFSVTVGQPVEFTDTSFGATSWLWDLGEDGATSTQQNPRYTYRTAGQKAVTLKVTNAFGSDSVTKFFPCHAGEEERLEAKFSWTPPAPKPGEAVRFTDLSTGAPERWSWVVSDGTQSGERSFTHTFSQPGEYAVSLRVDKSAQTHMLVQIVKVGDATGPTPNFSWSPGTPAANQLVRFRNLSLNATSYSWDFGDGTTSTEVDPEHRFADDKTYRVKLTARNAAGQSQSVTKDVRITSEETIPVASFEARPNPATVGKPVQFADTSTGRPNEWFWDFGYSNLTSSQQNPSHTFPFEGTFQVKLTARNGKGSSAPITLPVVVKKEALKPEADFDWSPANPAAGETVVFTDHSRNQPIGLHWIFEDGGTASGSPVQHRFSRPGNWKVTLEASNEAGLSTFSRTVTVSDALLQADFVVTPAEPVVGRNVQFRDTSRGEPNVWQWLVDGTEVGATRNLDWTFHSGGEHVVELRVRAGAQTSVRQQPIAVAAPPIASFKVIGPLVTGGSVTFTDTSAGVVTSRKWSIDGETVTRDASFARTFKAAGATHVRLDVENAAGADALTRTFVFTTRASERPLILGVAAQYGPCFYSMVPINDPVEVAVDWRKETPGSVALEINGVGHPPVPAAGPKALMTLDTRRLDYSADVTANRLLFTAASQGGTTSAPEMIEFFGVKTPSYMLFANATREIAEPHRRAFVRGIHLPNEPYEGRVRLPRILGGQSIELTKTQFKLENILRTDCSVTTNVEVSGGLKVGTGFAGLKGSGSFERKLSKTTGMRSSQELSLSLEAFAGFEQKAGVIEMIPTMTAPCQLPIISSICDVAEVKLEVQAGLGGVVEFDVAEDGKLAFKGASNTGELQIIATGTLGVGSAEFEVFGSGKGDIKFGRFDDTPFFRKVDAALEIGARLRWFGTLTEYKYGAACTYEPGKEFTCGENVAHARSGEPGVPLRAVPPVSRTRKVEDLSAAAPALLGNVSTLADPAAASRGDRSVVVYLSENAESGAVLQRLDVRAVRRGPEGWSEPETITSDSIGDFNPAVVVTPAGRTVVAWERIRNAAVNYADLTKLEDMPKLLREVEIAVSAHDTAWSEVSLLTSNELLDHRPSLTALSDGSVVLVWIREPADGKGPQQIVSRTLQANAWSAEVVVASELRRVDALALASRGQEAHLVASREGGLALFTHRDGAWSPLRELTGDGRDRSPALSFDADASRVYWTRGTSLLTRVLPDGEIETAREAGDRAAVVNPVVATRPDGAQVVLWSSGSDLRAVVRDPRTKSWSNDTPLTGGSLRHSSLSAFFTADATLHLVSLGRAADDSRADLIAIDTTLRVDLAAAGETISATPRQPNADEPVTIAIELQNRGELPVRDAIAELRRGEKTIATTTIAGDWMPGERRAVSLATTHETGPLTIVVDPAGATGDAVPENNVARFSFANRAPAACFQAGTGSGGSPLAVTFDAACSADGDGAIARYSWAFSDEGAMTGRTASHTFATAGTHTVLLTVTDDMGASATRSMSIDVGANDRREPAATHSLYFSVVARAGGAAGSFFVSDVAILNTDQADDLTIDAVYLPDGRADTYHERFTLRGGELLHARDVLARLFGAANGSGSIRLDLSHPHAVAVARTYNDQPAGTAGFSNEALRREEALRDGETGVILQHWLPGSRMNVGFTEVSGVQTEIVATAFDEKGVDLGSETFGLAPYEHKQVNGVGRFQARGRIEIAVRGGAVFAYGSTVDGRTGDPIYQAAERRPAEARTLLVPVLARLGGANNSSWRSDLRLFNAGSSAQTATMELRTPAATVTAVAELAPGETRSLDDVITVAFPQIAGNVGGAMTISAPGPLMASSRTFNVTSGGTYGLYVPARASGDLLSEGETAWLVQLQDNETYRCNLGITSFAEPVQVSVRAFDASGQTLATKTYAVAGGQNIQIGRVFADMGIATPLEAAGLEVTVIEGRAFVYASVNDNRTGDGTFIEARR
jgi:PKD repeat protein